MATNYEDWHKDDLYELATDLDIDGRSTMSKPELIAAIEAEEGDPSSDSGPSGDSAESNEIAPTDLEVARERVAKAKTSLAAAHSMKGQGGPDRVEERQAELDEAHEEYYAALEDEDSV